MINAIITGIMNLIMGLVNVLLSPIDLLISQFLPDLGNGFSAINSFLDYCIQYIGWVIDFTGIPSSCIGLIVSYYTFKLTVPIIVATIKLAIQWYDKLKL